MFRCKTKSGPIVVSFSVSVASIFGAGMGARKRIREQKRSEANVSGVFLGGESDAKANEIFARLLLLLLSHFHCFLVSRADFFFQFDIKIVKLAKTGLPRWCLPSSAS